MIIGTCYFVSLQAAQRYYSSCYHYTPDDVTHKIATGEISIGKPLIQAHETLSLIDDGTRYAINIK